MKKADFIQFKTFKFYPDQNRLNHDGKDIRLEPKVNELLLLFLKSAGKTITKEELFETLWSGQIVTEDSLKRVISKLRNSLSDQADSPEFIETITGKGYRFKYSESTGNKIKAGLIAVVLFLLTGVTIYFGSKSDDKFQMEYHSLTFDSNEEAKPFPTATDSDVVFISNTKLFDFYNTDILNLYNYEKKRLLNDSVLKFVSAYQSAKKDFLIEFVISRSFTGIRQVNTRTRHVLNLIDIPPSKMIDFDINYQTNELYYTAPDQKGSHVFKYSFETQELDQLSSAENYHDFRCRISDDNRTLAILRSNAKFQENRLVLLDLDSGLEEQINCDFELVDIDWNSDGYLYLVGRLDASSYLYRLNSDKDFKKLCEIDPQLTSFRSFNKSRSFVGVQWYSKRSVQQIDLKSGQLSEFDPISRSNFLPSLSANHHFIAMSTDRNRSVELQVLDLNSNEKIFFEMENRSQLSWLGSQLVSYSNDVSILYAISGNTMKPVRELPYSQIVLLDSVPVYYALRKEADNFELIRFNRFDEEIFVQKTFTSAVSLFTDGSNLYYFEAGYLYKYHSNSSDMIRQMPSSRPSDLAISHSGFYWIEHEQVTEINYHAFSETMDRNIYQFSEIRDIRFLTVDRNDATLFYQQTDNSNSNIVRMNLLSD